MEPSPQRGRTGVFVFAIVCVALGAVSLVLAFAVAEGEARNHATFHHFAGFVCLALFVAIALLWKPAPDGSTSMGRAALLIVTGMGAVGQLLEAIGASGYDRFNAGHEIEPLTSLHNSVGILGPVALLAIPIGVLAVVVLIIGLALGRRSMQRTD